MSAQALTLTPHGSQVIYQGFFWTTNNGSSSGTAAANGTFNIPVSTDIPSTWECTLVIQTNQVTSGSQTYPGLSVSTQTPVYTSGAWQFTWAQYNPAAGNAPQEILCRYIVLFSPSIIHSVDI